jgi:hypothetical protein
MHEEELRELFDYLTKAEDEADIDFEFIQGERPRLTTTQARVILNMLNFYGVIDIDWQICEHCEHVFEYENGVGDCCSAECKTEFSK